MTVNVSKPAINVRSKLAELDKPTGIAGEAMLRAETPQEQFNLIGAGRRNLIINGDMRIAQRGTSANITGYGYHTVDRWHTIANSGMNYNVTMSQELIADAPFGFSHSLKLLTTSAQTTVSGENYSLRYSIEGSDVRHLKYGTSNAEYITLSFWVKSNKAGTYSLQPYALNTAGNASYLTSYTITNPDTWEYKSVVIEPNTKRSINYTDTTGFFIDFNLDSGPDDIVSPYNWAVAGAARAVEGQVRLLDTVNNYFEITGVQLEVGKVATPFEHARSYGEELALCQRYFQVLGGSGTNYTLAAGFTSGTSFFGYGKLIKTMRVSPTFSVSGTVSDFGYTHVAVAAAASATPYVTTTPDTYFMQFGSSTSTTNNAGAYARITSPGTSAHFDAEL